ncbi:c-type heme family protein [Desulfobulbus alkaliphilus]|uniref:c-type heme family protein n=1 Tax=Desulfobulbus alkaliphilus TaxID=869814 RepID=UPI00196454C0|nr:DUF3365 domain-containing protein [Desulfobulbus alkaliphilus]MBM9538065.1 DUF3365 domain-containing protein [Desulfobulbus alkaliphilus]
MDNKEQPANAFSTQGTRDQQLRDKRSRRPLTIQRRFQLGTALILLFFCIISALLIYFHEKRILEQSAYAQTELVMAAVEATREYVRDELRPKMYSTFGHDYFMMEAMSTSYVSRAVMDRFRESMPAFDYRRVSINARNPDSEANAIEREMITYFQNNEKASNWQGLLESGGEAYYRRFQPVFFEASCLHCHGDPRDAPVDLVKIYGAERGFGHYAGELAGVIAVGIPVDSALAMIREKATSVFLVVFLGVSIFFLALSFFFHRVVVHNLHGLIDIFRRELEPHEEIPQHPLTSSRDEIEELTSAAIVMADRLYTTREELRSYTQTLEEQVAQRTQALLCSKQLLQEKIIARNQELHTLNTIAELTTQGTELGDMLPGALRVTLELIPAMGAGIFLHEKNQEQLILRYRENADCLPELIPLSLPLGEASVHTQEGCTSQDPTDTDLGHSITSAFTGQLVRFRSDQGRSLMHIPLDCRGNVLGVMTLTGLEVDIVSLEQEDLLISIGRQIGIAIESLNNVHRLIQSKELLQSVFDGITDLVVLLDRDFRIKMVNKAYLQRYKVDIDTVLNKPCYELHHEAYTSCADCGLKEVLASGKPMSKESRCITGSLFLINFYPLFNETGQVESIIRYARDITDQKRVEQQIQQTEKLVAMGQLAAGVAHEINNPLGVILCYVNLLQRQLSDNQQGHKDLEIIEKQTQNCKRIVTDLLQFARSQDSVKAPACLNTMLSEVVQMLEHQCKHKDISLELLFDQQLPMITVDVNKMKQVFVNLLLNAFQAVQQHGMIRISTAYHPHQQQAEIVFQDNGHGIPPEIQNKIFDPFFSTKQTGDGTGLGLSVSYGIIEEHDGLITVTSDPEAGTRFLIRLPVDRETTS